MRSSFWVIWKIFNFTLLLHSPVPSFGFNLLERNPGALESETAGAAIFGGKE